MNFLFIYTIFQKTILSLHTFMNKLLFPAFRSVVASWPPGPGFTHVQQVRPHRAQNSEGPKKLLSSAVSLKNIHQ
jgi:hypothetical protein